MRRGTKTTVSWLLFFFVRFWSHRTTKEFFGVESLQWFRATRAQLRRCAQSPQSLRRSAARDGCDNESKSDKMTCDICQVHGTRCVNVRLTFNVVSGDFKHYTVLQKVNTKGSAGLFDDCVAFHQFSLSVYTFFRSSPASFMLLLLSFALVTNISFSSATFQTPFFFP